MDVAQFSCPYCGRIGGVEVPFDDSLQVYRCKHCQKEVKTPEGHCCVICAYTDKRCSKALKREKNRDD